MNEDRFVSSRIADETLVYDHRTSRVHRLNPPAARLLDAVSAGRTAQAAAAQAFPGAAPDQARDALALGLRALAEAGLVEEGPPSRVSRRSFLRRWGRGAAVLATVTSVLTPSPAMAQSFPCVNCTGNAVTCAACTPGTCTPCFNPGPCVDCLCMSSRIQNSGACSTDTVGFARLCVDMGATSNPRVNVDCAVARAGVSGGAVTIVRCDGVMASFASTNYVCCQNCV